MQYEITTDLASIIICIVLMVFTLTNYGDNDTTRSYRNMLINTGLLCALDIVFAVNRSFVDFMPYWGDMLFTTIYLVCGINTARVFYMYVDTITDKDTGKTFQKVACNLLFLVSLVTLLLNIFAGFVFSYDELGSYQRGPAFAMVLVIPLVYCISAVIRICRHRRVLTSGQVASIIILIALSTLGFAIQLVWFPRLLIAYFFPTISYLVILITIETPDFNKLEKALAELKEAKEEAERARNEAEKATKAKSQFLANMSHEIRTPINAILGFDEMILRESRETGTRQYASDIRSSSKTLLEIINDILDFSRVESGKLEILPVEYNLFELLYGINNMISLRAKGKGIYFEMSVDSTVPEHLIGDEKRIRQILINILTNAVKYTDMGGAQLKLTYKKLTDTEIDMTVSVSDTGRGMKAEDITKLFKPYERLEEDKNGGVEGTGLGLTITKNLLEKMGSVLKVSSVYTQGSTFEFTITQGVARWDPIGDVNDRTITYGASEVKRPGRFIAPQASILVVDDTPVNIKVFRALLKQTKINIESCESGGEAFKLACTKHYDMLFLDHMMPDFDGVETLEVIQHFDMSKNMDTPAIMLTANAMAGAREEYIAKGFKDYLSKPIDSTTLENLLCTYLPEVYIVNVDDSQPVEEEEVEDSPLILFLKSIEDIAPLEGIKAAGGLEIYEQVVEEFFHTGYSLADTIEEYARVEDFKNYTIRVHSLKSTARLVGDLKLMKQAKYLEDCGRAEDLKEINLKTPKLLGHFRQLIGQLAPFYEKEDGGREISSAEVKECFMVIAESMERFDMDMADNIMKKLSECKLPEEYRDAYKKLKVLMAEVARDEIIELLKA